MSLTWHEPFEQQKIQKSKRNKQLSVALLCVAELSGIFFFTRSCSENKMMKVVTTRERASAYEALSVNHLNEIEVPIGSWNKDILDLKSAKKLIHQPLRIGILKGQFLTKDMFLSPMESASMAQKIPPGKRLMTLNVDLDGLENILHPSSLVDIVADLTLPEKGRVTGVIAEAVTLNGIGADIAGVGDENQSKQSVSFFVTPDEFNFFSFLKDKGKFSIALRNPSDHKRNNDQRAMTLNKFLASAPIRGIYENDLFQIKK